MNLMLVRSAHCPSSWQVADLLTERSRFHSDHCLVDQPERADAILFANLPDEDYFVELRTHPLLQRHPEKSFVYSDKDLALPLWPGMYTSIHHRARPAGWFRGAPYIGPCESRNDPAETPIDFKQVKQDLLFSFMGSSSSRIRKVLYHLYPRRTDIVIEDTGAYRHWDDEQSRAEKDYWQARYREICLRSRFVLCPRGAGYSSVRIFEALQMGRTPVIIADGWTPPRGPDWSQCVIRVPEKLIWRLPQILARYDGMHVEMGRSARAAWEQYFSPAAQFAWLAHEISDLLSAEAHADPHRYRWRAIIARHRASSAVSGSAINTLKFVAKATRLGKPLHIK